MPAKLNAAAVQAKRARVKEEVQTKETNEHLNDTRVKLDRVTKTLARAEEDKEMWKRQFEDCKKRK